MKTSAILKLEWDSGRTAVNLINGHLSVHGDYPIITHVTSQDYNVCRICGKRTAPNGCPDAGCVDGSGWTAKSGADEPDCRSLADRVAELEHRLNYHLKEEK